MHSNPFTDEELARRLNSVRAQMNQIGLDKILLNSREHFSTSLVWITGAILHRRRLLFQLGVIWYLSLDKWRRL